MLRLFLMLRRLVWSIVFFASFPGIAEKLASFSSAPLASYKAYYTLSLAPVVSTSNMTDVEGQMVVEFQDACSGWTLQQNSELWISTPEEESQEIRWNYVTWESKNGHDFRFNMRREVGGVVEDDLRGFVRLDANQIGEVIFKKPYYKALKLKKRTLLPTAHLLHLLSLAKKGEKFTSNTVFDGSSLDGPVEISAFIGKPHEPVGFSNLNRFKEHFGTQKFWPIRFAVYGAQSKGETPDLESAQQMLPNGLPLEYIIDYGDFRIKATLDRYELLGVKCTS